MSTSPQMSETQRKVLDEWLADRPQVIKDLAYAYPPDCYTFNDTGQHGVLYSYDEDGTITVNTTALGFLPVQVFGVNPANLTRCGCISTGADQ